MTNKKHLDLRVTNITTTNIPDEHGYETYRKKYSNWFNEPQKTFCKQWYDVIRFRTSFSLCLRVGIGPKPWDSPNFSDRPIFWGPPSSPPNTHWPVIIFHSNTAPWWGLSCSWVPNLYSKSNKSKFEQKFPIAMLIYVGLAKGTPKTESLRFPSHPNSRETPHPNQHGASPRGPKEICKNPSEQGVGSKKSKDFAFSSIFIQIFPEKSFEQPHKLRQRSPNSQACVPFFRPKRMPPHGIRPGSTHSREACLLYMVNHSKSLYKSI